MTTETSTAPSGAGRSAPAGAERLWVGVDTIGKTTFCRFPRPPNSTNLYKDPRSARLPRLRPPLPVHDRRRRALVPRPRRPPGRARTLGHLPDPAALAARRAPGAARDRSSRGRAEIQDVCAWAETNPPCARVRAGCAGPPAETRPPL